MEATSILVALMDEDQTTVQEQLQRLSYAGSLLPVSPSENGSSTSGFCADSDSTTCWTSRTTSPLRTDMDHCCSLLNNIWKFPSPSIRNETDVKASQPISNSNFSFSCFSESQTIHKTRTVVSVDVEHIAPNDEPHHPFDREFGSAADVPRKMFTRKPYGIAVNTKTEQIYVADREYNVVLILGPDGAFQSQLGGPGTEPGQFKRPTGLAFDDASDRLYITDKDNHRVQVFNATTGQFLFRFGSKGNNAGQLLFPWGIAILNKEGRLLVAIADSRNARVQFFTKEGLYLDQFDAFSSLEEDHNPTTTGRKKPARHQPRGLAFDRSGDVLYISDFNHHCIFKLDLIGRTFGKLLLTQYSRSFNRPCGLDVDSDGNLFICDQRNQSLRKFRKDGTEVEGFLKGVTFELPMDVSLYPGLPGYLAVIDLNGRIRVLNYSN